MRGWLSRASPANRDSSWTSFLGVIGLAGFGIAAQFVGVPVANALGGAALAFAVSVIASDLAKQGQRRDLSEAVESARRAAFGEVAGISQTTTQALHIIDELCIKLDGLERDRARDAHRVMAGYIAVLERKTGHRLSVPTAQVIERLKQELEDYSKAVFDHGEVATEQPGERLNFSLFLQGLKPWLRSEGQTIKRTVECPSCDNTFEVELIHSDNDLFDIRHCMRCKRMLTVASPNGRVVSAVEATVTETELAGRDQESGRGLLRCPGCESERLAFHIDRGIAWADCKYCLILLHTEDPEGWEHYQERH